MHELERVALNRQKIAVSTEMCDHPDVELYPVHSWRSAGNQFYCYILPLGRGFSLFIDSMTSVTMDDKTKIATCEGTGRYFSSSKGTWRLEVDTQNQYLVRRSLYNNVVRTESDGDSWPGELQILKKGQAFFFGGRRVISVVVKDYARETDSEFLTRTLAEIESAMGQPGVRVDDYNAIDSAGVPFTYVVQEIGE